MMLRGIGAAVADVVLPTACAGCARPGERLCRSCCTVALQHVDMAGLPTVAATEYAGGIRAALVAYKDRDRRELAAPLGRLLGVAAAAAADGATAVALVPVPSTRAASRRRGGNHVVRLARQAGRLLRLPVCDALTLNRFVRDAAHLSAEARSANMARAMSATAPITMPAAAHGRLEAVIVDDIVTTGATVAEAARALVEAGWQVRGAAAIARPRLRRPPLRSGRSPSGTT